MGSIEATHPSSRATSWGKGSLWTTPATAMSCTSRTRHGAANYHPNIGSVHRHPKNKYLQWQHGTLYHKVQCIKDHYLESVVRESIMRSLKGAAADMACYMGPTASASKILEKLSVIFGMVM